MASLVQAYCPDCTYCCFACHLNREMLQSMEEENKEVYKKLKSLKMVFVFCQRAEVFIVAKSF